MAKCKVCFRQCDIEEGKLGFCGGRTCRAGIVVPENYGRITSLALDPIEKKPLNRFYPEVRFCRWVVMGVTCVVHFAKTMRFLGQMRWLLSKKRPGTFHRRSLCVLQKSKCLTGISVWHLPIMNL
jgi:hypothetical protein